MTPAGIASGLPLLLGLIALRIFSAYERSNGDPVAVAWTVAGVVALIVVMLALVVLINGRLLSGAHARRQTIEQSGAHWLADVTIDRHSRELLGMSGAERTRTFALVTTPGRVEFWATGPVPLAIVDQTRVLSVVAVPVSWGLVGAASIALELDGLTEPLLLDVVGPLTGTFPAPRARLDRIVAALFGADALR